MKILPLLMLLICAKVSAQVLIYTTGDGQFHKVEKSKQFPVLAEDDTIRTFGVVLGAGIPEGIAPGISIHPGTNSLHLDLAATGLMSPGFHLGATLDPFDTILAPTLTISAGHHFWASLPRSSAGKFDATYFTTQLGLEFGRRSRFRIFVRAGYSRIWVNTRNATDKLRLAGLAITQPKVTIDLLPALSAGVTAYF